MMREGPFWDVMAGRAVPPPAAGTLDWQLIVVEPDAGTIEVAFRATEQFLNPVGVVQGGFLAAMLDDTLGPALVATLGPGEFAPTADLHVQFLRPARPGRLIGRGRIVRRGGGVGFLAGELIDETGAVVAKEVARQVSCSHQAVCLVLRGNGAQYARSAWVPAEGRLSVAEREEISLGVHRGETFSAIASRLGRATSTGSREVAANGGRGGYRAWRAHQRARERTRHPKVPKLSCPRLETIYQALFVQGRGELRRELVRCLRTGRAARRSRGRRENSGRIPGMVVISDRPAEAGDRAVPGHWEGDLILGKSSKSAGHAGRTGDTLFAVAAPARRQRRPGRG